MAMDQNFVSQGSQDEKKWDRPWTVDEIRKNSSNWTLAGDVGLYNLLNEFSHNIISRTHEVENAVDSLVHKTKMASAKINNIISDFHMLSNLQFVENRVYDEEIQETVHVEKISEPKTKEQKEAEMLPKIITAIELGLTVLDKAFDRINVNEISDSEDEDLSSEGRTILEPKDPYENRPLPFIIGSEEFQNSDCAGLQDLLEEVEDSVEVESSISETDETSSDEDESLPLDEDKFSTNERKEAQSISDRISSSEESELFGSEKAENGFLSDSSLERKTKESKNIQRTSVEVKTREKGSRQNSISSIHSKLNLPQVLPMPKQEESKKEADLFTNEDEASDDESPFRKKTGLFTSDLRVEEEKDMFSSGLFGEKPKKPLEKIQKPLAPQPKQVVAPVVESREKRDLFDDDEDSEDDIFHVAVKAKKPVAKENKVISHSSPEKDDTPSTPSSAPSVKSSGNAFDFGSGGGSSTLLFGDESDADDLFSSKKTSKKFDFDSYENDDLFGITNAKSPKSESVEKTKPAEEKKISLFDDTYTDGPQVNKTKSTDENNSLFGDIDSLSTSNTKVKKAEKVLPGLEKKLKSSIFEDSDGSDLESIIPVKSDQPASSMKKKNEISLFDDDDAEDDIFSQVKKQVPASSKMPSMKQESLFSPLEKDKTDNTEPIEVITKPEPVKVERKSEPIKVEKKSEPVKVEQIKHKPSLFEDDSEPEEIKEPVKLPNIKKSKPSIFEDSDNFDLFKPKVQEKPPEPYQPVQLPKPSEKEAPFDVSDGMAGDIISKTERTPPPKVPDTADSQIGFDIPVDSSKTLNVLSKDRAKISAKRRKPTRKGRLSALENTDKESIPSNSIITSSSQSSALSSTADDLFSPVHAKKSPSMEPTQVSHKAQEKKKMNLMSQLMSEVTAKRSAQNPPVQEDEDEVDIFAEASNKDRSKSQSFSFLSPVANTIDSDFLNVEKEDKKEEPNVLDSDSADNEEFFTEPSFRNFRNSISRKDPVLDLVNDDDEDDDDLFSTITSTILPKPKTDDPDIFADDSDIFADVQREKYEMFPSQLYDDDEDIFGSMDQPTSDKTSVSAKAPSATTVKKEIEKKPVNVFEDPLTGLLGDD